MGAVYALGLLSSSSSTLQQQASSYMPPPWLFPGAYATYSGVTASDLVPINITLKIQVVTWNDTSVETRSDFLFRSSIYTAENESTGWASVAQAFTAQSPDFTFAKSFNSTQQLVGVATCNCVAYLYVSGNTTLTVYVGKGSVVPVEVLYTDSSTALGRMTLDMPVVRSNIPGAA